KKGRDYRYLRCEGAREGRGCTNDGYYSYAAFEDTAIGLCLDLAMDDRFFEVTGELRELRIKKAEREKTIAIKREARNRVLRVFEAGDDQMEDRLKELKEEISQLA